MIEGEDLLHLRQVVLITHIAATKTSRRMATSPAMWPLVKLQSDGCFSVITHLSASANDVSVELLGIAGAAGEGTGALALALSAADTWRTHVCAAASIR